MRSRAFEREHGLDCREKDEIKENKEKETNPKGTEVEAGSKVPPVHGDGELIYIDREKSK